MKIELTHECIFETQRKVYKQGNFICKSVNYGKNKFPNQRMNSPLGEYKILKRLQGISGIPTEPKFCKKDKVIELKYKFIEGETLQNLLEREIPTLWFWLQLAWLLILISIRGVAHRDVKPQNILVDKTQKVWLIDFDQAITTSQLEALKLNMFGSVYSSPSVHGSYQTVHSLVKDKMKNRKNVINMFKMFSKKILKTILPSFLIEKYRHYMSNKQKKKRPSEIIIPNLMPSASKKLVYLRKAWLLARDSDASSPGIQIAYYSLDEEGYHFPGERPWYNRWQYLSKSADFERKRVLELGCNMGLLSTFLLKEMKISGILGIDTNHEILAAAQLVAGAYDVNPLFQRVDFDSNDNWEDGLLKFNPDIVFALNILNWLNNKSRFIDFLCNFNVIIFEGHDSFDMESEIFERNGYVIEKLAISERKRTVFKAQKS